MTVLCVLGRLAWRTGHNFEAAYNKFQVYEADYLFQEETLKIKIIQPVQVTQEEFETCSSPGKKLLTSTDMIKINTDI
jgi:hypothetical protein